MYWSHLKRMQVNQKHIHHMLHALRKKTNKQIKLRSFSRIDLSNLNAKFCHLKNFNDNNNSSDWVSGINKKSLLMNVKLCKKNRTNEKQNWFFFVNQCLQKVQIKETHLCKKNFYSKSLFLFLRCIILFGILRVIKCLFFFSVNVLNFLCLMIYNSHVCFCSHILPFLCLRHKIE